MAGTQSPDRNDPETKERHCDHPAEHILPDAVLGSATG
jgi:hypothetical protein